MKNFGGRSAIVPSGRSNFAGVRPPQSERVRKVRFSFDDLNLEFAHWFVHVDLGTHQRGWLIWSWKAQTWSSGSAILDRKQFFGTGSEVFVNLEL